MLAACFLFAPTAAAAPTETFPHSSSNTALRPEKETAKTVKIAPGEAKKAEVGNSVMEKIAFCESRNNPSAKNPKSTASGRFQFLRGSWEYYGTKKWGSLEGRNVFDNDDNTELAYWVASEYGLSPWYASRHCWG